MPSADSINPSDILSSSLQNRQVDVSTLKIPFEMLPEDYLDLAEKNRTSAKVGNGKEIVDAISDAKRAIDCQVSCLIFAFGFHYLSKKKKWKFNKKVEVLNAIGLKIPGILARKNAARNIVEHEYKKPSREDVSDAIDTATLFLQGSENFYKGGVNKIEIGKENARFEITFDRNRGYIKIVDENRKNSPRMVSYQDYDNYLSWMREILKLHKKIIEKSRTTVHVW